MNEQQKPQTGDPAIGLPEDEVQTREQAQYGQAYAATAGGAQTAPYQYYAPRPAPPRTPYNFAPGDAAFACFSLTLGFLIGVTSLLIQSDRGFAQFPEDFADWLGGS